MHINCGKFLIWGFIQDLFTLYKPFCRLTLQLLGLISLINLDSNFQTPLHLAVITRQPVVVQMLVSAGVQVDLQDRNGKTALHLACERGNIECVQEITRPLVDTHFSEEARERALDMLDARNFEGMLCGFLIQTSFVSTNTIPILISSVKIASCSVISLYFRYLGVSPRPESEKLKICQLFTFRYWQLLNINISSALQINHAKHTVHQWTCFNMFSFLFLCFSFSC